MKLIDSNRYYLPNTKKQWLHLGTATDGLHEYLCMAEVQSQRIYIERITGGQLEFISDDGLAAGLANFFEEKGVTDRTKPLLPDKEWYNLGKK